MEMIVLGGPDGEVKMVEGGVGAGYEGYELKLKESG